MFEKGRERCDNSDFAITLLFNDFNISSSCARKPFLSLKAIKHFIAL